MKLTFRNFKKLGSMGWDSVRCGQVLNPEKMSLIKNTFKGWSISSIWQAVITSIHLWSSIKTSSVRNSVGMVFLCGQFLEKFMIPSLFQWSCIKQSSIMRQVCHQHRLVPNLGENTILQEQWIKDLVISTKIKMIFWIDLSSIGKKWQLHLRTIHMSLLMNSLMNLGQAICTKIHSLLSLGSLRSFTFRKFMINCHMQLEKWTPTITSVLNRLLG